MATRKSLMPTSRTTSEAFSELLKSVARRVVDRRVLHLIKMWLESPVEETDERRRKTRTTGARDNRRGMVETIHALTTRSQTWQETTAGSCRIRPSWGTT
jgi:hypothetical protein